MILIIFGTKFSYDHIRPLRILSSDTDIFMTHTSVLCRSDGALWLLASEPKEEEHIIHQNSRSVERKSTQADGYPGENT